MHQINDSRIDKFHILFSFDISENIHYFNCVKLIKTIIKMMLSLQARPLECHSWNFVAHVNPTTGRKVVENGKSP